MERCVIGTMGFETMFEVVVDERARESGCVSNVAVLIYEMAISMPGEIRK